MIIIYKPKVNHLLRIPGKASTLSTKKGKQKGNNILIPGSNSIDDEIWNEIKKHVSIKLKIKSGELEAISKEILSEKPDEKGNKRKIEKALNLSDMEIDKAIDIIKNCNNLDTLKEWKKEKGLSEELRLEIKERIEAVEYFIKTGKEKKDE